ncbi:hypothetical protein FHW64_005401 [Variovorax sp. Sphag1AA]|nr:hypothetical protein [Variovorax sp. Sphag1AA]
MRLIAVSMALGAMASAWSQTPPILIEACSAMQPAAKRGECLRAANELARASIGSTFASRPSSAPQALYAPSTSRGASVSSQASTTRPPGSSYSVGGKTCYVGPRGGTYTITASGRKNYSGC